MRTHLVVTLLSLAGISSAGAAPIVYANNAGSPHIDIIDGATGAVTSEFTLNGGSGNGRGVVVVGNTLYFTLANSGTVFTHNLTTNAEGVAFTVAGASGLSTIAWDGSDFWIGDYSGTNQAYHYTPTGTLLSTIHLSNCTGQCDGLEFFLQNGQGRLISNRGDSVGGPYDVYDTSGNLVHAAFLTDPTGASTGIAFDGTNFWVAERTINKLAKFDGTTGAFISSETITGAKLGLNVEDLSGDYNLVLPPPGVPEPSTWILMSVGLGAILVLASRRRRVRI